MAGRGPAPKPAAERRNTTVPGRGEWGATDAVGWQHGEVPEPPDGLLKESRAAWATWFASWWAAHWAPEDLPGLEVVILLYDEVRRGGTQRAGELRLQLDTYGITPKGQQDRRWQRPAAEDKPETAPVRQLKPRRLHSA